MWVRYPESEVFEKIFMITQSKAGQQDLTLVALPLRFPTTSQY